MGDNMQAQKWSAAVGAGTRQIACRNYCTAPPTQKVPKGNGQKGTACACVVCHTESVCRLCWDALCSAGTEVPAQSASDAICSRMSTQWQAFVAALGKKDTHKYIVDANAKCAVLRAAEAAANCPPAALKQHLLALLQVPTQLLIPAESHNISIWSVAKIFDGVLCYLDVSATDSTSLVTRTYFPWAKVPARVASVRTAPHPAAPGRLVCAIASSTVDPCHPRP